MKDKKLEDAINATRAAVEEGIVPGGGATLAHLSENVVTWAKNNLKEDELIGAMIISRAILAPLRRKRGYGAVIIEKFNNKNLRSVITLLNTFVTCMRKV
jgi:chaperonin GroEL